jgi:hypothetical protein
VPPFLSHKNRQLSVDLTPLVEAGLEVTLLSADVAASSSTLTVKDIDGFAVSQYVLIGELGQETSEIIKIHASTAPTGTTITLASNTTYAHSAGTKVYRIEFDQIEFSYASTATGSKSVLTTANIQADQKIQVYTDTSQTSGYYFARFKNSGASTYGSYTDAIAYGGWDDYTVGALIEQALKTLGITLSNALSRTDCYKIINSGMRFIQGKQVHFPQNDILGYVLGQAARGTYSWTLPTDIYDNDSSKSIYTVKVGASDPLVWFDPREMDDYREGQVTTQVRTQATAGDTSLAIDNSYDFADSGTITFYISGTKYTATYTGVTRSATAGVLTGIPSSGDGSITVTVPVDTNIFQNVLEGTPTYFTVRNGNLEIAPMPDSANDDMNVYLDYSTAVTKVDSDGDEIDVQRYDMVLDYFTWAIKMRVKNNGALDMNDGWFISFKEKLNDAIRTSRPRFTFKMKPKINKITY